MRETLQEMCQADMLHYKREQRKFIHNEYEKYIRISYVSYDRFLKSNYEKLKPEFDKQFFAQHRMARDYLATVNPQ